MSQQPGNVHLCIEEGEWSQWLHEILSPHVAELVVYRAQWAPGSKSDQRDADGLSERMRTGKVGVPVYKDRKQFGALREASRRYTMLTRDQVRVKRRLPKRPELLAVFVHGHTHLARAHPLAAARQRSPLH